MDFTNFTPIPISQGSKDTIVQYRPYYTERNATQLQPLFDKIIDGGQSCLILPTQLGLHSVSALHSKLLYAIRWLCDKHQNKDKYSKFRNLVIFKRTGTGVEIIFEDIRTLLAANVIPTTIAPDTTKNHWFDTFANWLSHANELEIFDSMQVYGGRIEISDQSELAIIKLCASIGAELDCDKAVGKFKVMR